VTANRFPINGVKSQPARLRTQNCSDVELPWHIAPGDPRPVSDHFDRRPMLGFGPRRRRPARGPPIQTRTIARTQSAIKRVADHVHSMGYLVLDIDLLGDFYRVVDLDAEVANRGQTFGLSTGKEGHRSRPRTIMRESRPIASDLDRRSISGLARPPRPSWCPS
jgi:hypothetical protein